MTLRVLSAAAALSCCLLATACGSSSKPTQQEGVYALAVQQDDPTDLGAVDANKLAGTLASEGHGICDDLKSGQSAADEIAKVSLGFNATEAAALVREAPALCPDQQSKIAAAG